MSNNTKDSKVQATQTSVDILTLLSNSERLTLTEIAEELDLAPSTIHAHLGTLEANNLVTKRSQKYTLGIRLFHYGQCARRNDPRYTAAKQRVEELSNTTGNEAEFLVEDNGRMLSLFDSLAPSAAHLGSYYYMHTSATGKAILAELPQSQVEQILDHWGLPTQTDSAITTRDELYDELAEVRENGIAINEQETRDGIYSVGAAVSTPDGKVFGGISVSSPTYLLEPNYEERMIDPLLSTVEELEKDLIDLA